MTAPDHSSPVSPARSAWRSRVLLFLAWLGLTVFFFTPTREAMDITLDSSNYASYSHFTARGFQYGTEVVPMSGPYGFVTYGATYSGDLFWIRVAADLAVKGTLAALVLWFIAGSAGAGVLRWCWLAALLVFTNTIDDLPVEWTVLLTGFWLLRHRDSRWRTLALVLLLSFIALFKGTQLTLTCATLGLLCIHELLRRDYRRAAALAATFAAGFTGWWLLAGQDPRHIPAYLRGVAELTSGYNQAMGLLEPAAIFQRGLTTLLLLVAAMVWAAWRCRRHLSALAGLVLLAGFSFVKWKHGFVRADGHVYLFFNYVAVAVFTYGCWTAIADSTERARPMLRLGSAALNLLVFFASLYGAGDGMWWRFGWHLEQVPVNALTRSKQLISLPAAKADLDRALERKRKIYTLPTLQKAVGRQPVDMFGFDHGIILLNRLNYRPRPMGGGSFNVYTPYLMQLNAAFVRDAARRPDYFLFKLQTIDNRLSALDDSQALLEILRHYQPELIEQDFVLLKDLPSSGELPLVRLSQETITFGQNVPVPSVPPDHILLASFDFKPTWRGRLRTLLYKPTMVFFNMEGSKLIEPYSRRFIPAMASQPFILNPAIEDTADFLELYTGNNPGKLIHDYRLATDVPQDFAPGITVTYYTLPRPAPPAIVDIEELIRFARYPVANTPPESMNPPGAQRTYIDGQLVQLLLAPADVTWKLEGDERELLFDYGYDPAAYAKGEGDGVIVQVELKQPGLPDLVVFKRLLNPAHVPEHRGNHRARVVLPLFNKDSRLVLRMDPGQDRDNSWDWPYVAKIQLRRGVHSIEQFPGFNRAPTRADTSYASIVDHEGRSVLMLHAPGSLTYYLHGSETRLDFDYGFLPGAYNGEGKTDGAVYRVELARLNRPRELLFQRHLAPLTEAADRGRQSATVTLPKLGPGDRLILTIDPGPGGSNSWDWTYVTHFELK